MNNIEIFTMIVICAFCTFLTRALPFLVFKNADQLPSSLQYISNKLPLAIMMLLVLYCLRSTLLFQFPYGIPQISGVLFVIVLHIWKRNIMLSIAGGTVFYMFLMQVIFI